MQMTLIVDTLAHANTIKTSLENRLTTSDVWEGGVTVSDNGDGSATVSADARMQEPTLAEWKTAIRALTPAQRQAFVAAFVPQWIIDEITPGNGDIWSRLTATHRRIIHHNAKRHPSIYSLFNGRQNRDGAVAWLKTHLQTPPVSNWVLSRAIDTHLCPHAGEEGENIPCTASEFVHWE
jgi:hypothetical protein